MNIFAHVGGKDLKSGRFNVTTKDVTIYDNARIGNNCTIDGKVRISHNVIIGNNVTIIGDVFIGDNTIISDGARLGGAPNISSQLDYKGKVVIGNDCYIGENVVITGGGKYDDRDDVTRIAPRVLIMANSVIHHNCIVGFSEHMKSNMKNIFDTTISTGVVMNGCCNVAKGANIGSGTNIHQFTHIGEGAMVAMGSSIVKDILPFTKYINGEIVGLNGYVIKNLVEQLNIQPNDIEFITKDVFELVDQISTHQLSYRAKTIETLKRKKSLSDGLIYQMICEFALSERAGKARKLCKGNIHMNLPNI